MKRCLNAEEGEREKRDLLMPFVPSINISFLRREIGGILRGLLLFLFGKGRVLKIDVQQWTQWATSDERWKMIDLVEDKSQQKRTQIFQELEEFFS